MLYKDKITSIFCIIDDILKEINHSEDIPPLPQAYSLCPIHNSLPVPLVPLVPPVPPVPKFTIPLALFRVHYRLKKRLYLWCIKGNSGVVLLYCID